MSPHSRVRVRRAQKGPSSQNGWRTHLHLFPGWRSVPRAGELSRKRTSLDWSAFFQKHDSYIQGIVRRYIADSSLAEDVAQEARTRIAERYPTYDPERPIRRWLYSITRGVAVDHLRRENNQHHWRRNVGATVTLPLSKKEASLIDLMPAIGGGVFEDVTGREDRRIIRSILARMKPDHQRVLSLRYIQGQTYRQIAAETGLTYEQVKNRLSLAKSAFRKAYLLRSGGTLPESRVA